MLARYLAGAANATTLQFVGGNKAILTSGSATTLSLTALTGGLASAAAAGDIVIATYIVNNFSDLALGITDGTNNYTLIGSELFRASSGSSTGSNVRVAYKILTGADASVTFAATTANKPSAGAVHVWRGAHKTTPIDVTPTTASANNSGRPNPPAVTPVTAGAKIIAVGGATASTSFTAFTSSDLSNFFTQNAFLTNYAGLGIGSADWTSGAFDPAAFGGGGGTSTANSWVAMTFALRPE